MRWYVLLVWLISLGVAGAAAPPDAVNKELIKFQGSWKAISMQYPDGRQATADEVKNTRLVVEGDQFTMTIQSSSVSGTFLVNPSTTPPSIDAVLTPQGGHETRLLGIYQIQGDTRTSCFALPDKERLKSFSAEKGYFRFEWKKN
jgi:uncharacterized protein (TIGR03067 family)